jgi:hypothetical protein
MQFRENMLRNPYLCRSPVIKTGPMDILLCSLATAGRNQVITCSKCETTQIKYLKITSHFKFIKNYEFKNDTSHGVDLHYQGKSDIEGRLE